MRSRPGSREATAAELTAARKLPDAVKLQLLESLAGPRARAVCAVCGDLPEDPQVATCGDVMCRCGRARLRSRVPAAGEFLRMHAAFAPMACLPTTLPSVCLDQS